jgi:hemolysin activation/secretion protein
MSINIPILSPRKKENKLFSFFIIFLLLLPFQAIAQNLPPGSQPGAQGSRFQAESEQEKKRLEKKKIQAPQITIEKEKAKPSEVAGLSFLLKKVKVTGATVFKPEDLRPAY